MFYEVDCIALLSHCHEPTQHGGQSGHIADFYYKFTKSVYTVLL